jgi:hypothetical protein
MNLAATSDNLVLLLAFFGFYLADCVVLLRPAQALALPTLARRRRGQTVPPGLGVMGRCRIALDFGMTVYPVRGRYLALLNPLTPFLAVFKTRPIDDGGVGAMAMPLLTLPQMISVRIRMARMSLALTTHGVLMFVILPLLLLSGEIDRLLIAVAAAFLSAILILTVCYFDRRAARLSNAGFWTIAGQTLLCLPTSLNTPRKLALLCPAVMPAPQLLPAVPEDQRQAALGELRLTLERAADDESQSLAQAAEALRQKLAADYPEA